MGRQPHLTRALKSEKGRRTVKRHLIHLRVVEFLNLAQGGHIALGNEVDCNSFTAKPSTAADSVCNTLDQPLRSPLSYPGDGYDLRM
jgi:hypothetical protein